MILNFNQKLISFVSDVFFICYFFAMTAVSDLRSNGDNSKDSEIEWYGLRRQYIIATIWFIQSLHFSIGSLKHTVLVSFFWEYTVGNRAKPSQIRTSSEKWIVSEILMVARAKRHHPPNSELLIHIFISLVVDLFSAIPVGDLRSVRGERRKWE